MTDETKTKPPYLPVHIANYLLWLADKDGYKITPLKLLKLVYFGYAWYLNLTGKKLFTEPIEAWRFGPVVPSLYHEFKRFGNHPITGYAEFYNTLEDDTPQYLTINGDDKTSWAIVCAAWKHYKDKSAIELTNLTHEVDSPWHEAYEPGQNVVLDDEKISARAQKAIDEYVSNINQAV